MPVNDLFCVHCDQALSKHVFKGGSYKVWCPDRDEFFEAIPEPGKSDGPEATSPSDSRAGPPS